MRSIPASRRKSVRSSAIGGRGGGVFTRAALFEVGSAGAEDFGIPAERPKSENFTYAVDLRLSERSHVKFSGKRNERGHVHTYTLHVHVGVASRIFESPGAPLCDGGTISVRARTRALPSSPALTCRPFFFVPPTYRARFFKAAHVLSMCDMPLKRHGSREGDTRVRTRGACAYLTLSRPPYINVYYAKCFLLSPPFHCYAEARFLFTDLLSELESIFLFNVNGERQRRGC